MIKTNFSNEDRIAKIKSDLRNTQGLVEVRKSQIISALTSEINQRLAALLGDKVKHFNVQVIPGPMGVRISVKITDAVGSYIYYGTKPHPITSAEAMPVGAGQFAMSVSHPGTASMKQDIDGVINEAILAIKVRV